MEIMNLNVYIVNLWKIEAELRKCLIVHRWHLILSIFPREHKPSDCIGVNEGSHGDETIHRKGGRVSSVWGDIWHNPFIGPPGPPFTNMV